MRIGRGTSRALMLGALVAALSLLSLFGAKPADAHAFLLSATPAQGQRLQTVPNKVSLTFSEAIAAGGSAISAVDLTHGVTKATHLELSPDGRAMSTSLAVQAGAAYQIRWQAVSAIDGHETDGTFAFGVGTASGALPSATNLSQPVKPVPVSVNWLLFLGLSLGGGGMVVGAVVDKSLSTRSRSIRAGLALAFLGSVIASAVSISGIGRPIPSPPHLLHLDLATAVLLAIAVALVGRDKLWPPLVAVGAATVAWAGTGHGAAQGGILGWGVEALHLAGAAVWAGTLAHLALRLRSAVRENEVSWSVLGGYVAIAVTSVVVLAGAGGLLALIDSPTITSLLHSAYGHLLFVKTGLFAGAVLLGLATHRGFLRRRAGEMRRFAPIEAAVIAGIFVVSAVVAEVGPPAAPVAADILIGPPPLTGNLLYVGGLAGEITVGVSSGPDQSRVEVFEAATPAADAHVSLSARLAGDTQLHPLASTSCGPGCFSVPLQLRDGANHVVVTTSHTQLPGGTFDAELDWPVPPNQPELLQQYIAVMNAVPAVRIVEHIHTGTATAPPTIETDPGAAFIKLEPYVGGANSVHALPGGQPGFSLYIADTGSTTGAVWLTAHLDAQGRIISEELVNASNDIQRTFTYLPG
jgi:copper transport protein